MYRITIGGVGRYFSTFDTARKIAGQIFDACGVLLGIDYLTDCEAGHLLATAMIHGELQEVVVLNPGEGDGKCWLLTHSAGYDTTHFLVEAPDAAEAVNVLAADSQCGSLIEIDIELSGDDYWDCLEADDWLGDEKMAVRTWISLKGTRTADEPDCWIEYNLTDDGTPIDMDNLDVHGQYPYPCRYLVPMGNGEMKLITPAEYGNWEPEEEPAAPESVAVIGRRRRLML